MHQLGGNQDSTKFSELLEMMVYPCPLVLRPSSLDSLSVSSSWSSVSDSEPESKSESFSSSLSSSNITEHFNF